MKNKRKLLLSNTYIYKTGTRHIFILANKKNDRTLTLELTNKGGEIIFELEDVFDNIIETLTNPESNTYEFLIRKNHKYKIRIKHNKSIGKEIIYLENQE